MIGARATKLFALNSLILL